MVDDGRTSGEARRRRGRARRWLLLGCASAAVLLGLALVFRGAWAGPLLIRYLTERARRDLGAELTIERVSGGWWRDLTFEA